MTRISADGRGLRRGQLGSHRRRHLWLGAERVQGRHAVRRRSHPTSASRRRAGAITSDISRRGAALLREGSADRPPRPCGVLIETSDPPAHAEKGRVPGHRPSAHRGVCWLSGWVGGWETVRMLPDLAVALAGVDLPVREILPELVDSLARHGTAVLVAPPGTGKTTLVPLALGGALVGRGVVAEPRRAPPRGPSRARRATRRRA